MGSEQGRKKRRWGWGLWCFVQPSQINYLAITFWMSLFQFGDEPHISRHRNDILVFQPSRLGCRSSQEQIETIWGTQNGAIYKAPPNWRSPSLNFQDDIAARPAMPWRRPKGAFGHSGMDTLGHSGIVPLIVPGGEKEFTAEVDEAQRGSLLRGNWSSKARKAGSLRKSAEELGSLKAWG